MSNTNHVIIDCYPGKAQYLFGEQPFICITTKEKPQDIKVSLFRLAQWVADAKEYTTEPAKNGNFLTKALFPQNLPCACYGVDISTDGDTFSTAFDIVNSVRESLRYGFLADFSAEEAESEDVEYLSKLHVNAIQFYDWMYRHDHLVSKEESYEDPMGRPTALAAIREKIDACKRLGIRPFAYGAVYSAGRELFEEHPDWGLYTMDGQPMTFADWLYFMNPAEGSPWSTFIVHEYVEAVRQLGFQGIHMDTYGYPKNVWDSEGNTVSLAKEYPALINNAYRAVVSEDPQAGVIFNAVNNWPVETVALAEQDAVYIEVWPPHDNYYDLYTLIREASRISGKGVILAAYMKPFQDADTEEKSKAAETALLLANAVICASGGNQLVFGENQGVLCDSYYVKYAKLRDSFFPKVRSYCDYSVRYASLLTGKYYMDISMTAANGINDDIVFSSQQAAFSSCGEEDRVWTIVRQSERLLVIHLINLCGIDNRWNEPKPFEPKRVDDIEISILLDRPIKNVYAATPDNNDCRPQSLTFVTDKQKNGRRHLIHVPELKLWNTIWLEFEE